MSPTTLIANEALGYGAKVVLEQVTFALAPGERVALLGKSGAGKSTLLGALYARLTARGERVALVPQDHALVPQLSVFHNVFMGRLDERGSLYNLANLLWPWAQERGRIRPILQAVRLEPDEDRAVEALSGGQKQRVALARALFRGGEVLIGDEPLSAVDEAQARDLLDLISRRFPTTILAMHDVGLALTQATRVIGIHAGRIVFDQPSAAVARPEIDALYRA